MNYSLIVMTALLTFLVSGPVSAQNHAIPEWILNPPPDVNNGVYTTVGSGATPPQAVLFALSNLISQRMTIMSMDNYDTQRATSSLEWGNLYIGYTSTIGPGHIDGTLFEELFELEVRLMYHDGNTYLESGLVVKDHEDDYNGRYFISERNVDFSGVVQYLTGKGMNLTFVVYPEQSYVRIEVEEARLPENLEEPDLRSFRYGRLRY